MCPGFLKSEAELAGSASRRMVVARSAAEMPVEMPFRASTVTAQQCTLHARLQGTSMTTGRLYTVQHRVLKSSKQVTKPRARSKEPRGYLTANVGIVGSKMNNKGA